MVNTLKISILLTILCVVQRIACYYESKVSSCIIKNMQYSNEFLYSHHTLEEKNIMMRSVFTNPINRRFIKSFDQAEWLLKPIHGYSQTFYIESGLYKNQHLCALNNLELMNMRRKVSLVNLKIDSKTNAEIKMACAWKLERLKSSNDTVFFIRSLKYNESLVTTFFSSLHCNFILVLCFNSKYAASTLFKAINSRRNVYTWYKQPDSKKVFSRKEL
jgi:hypothetical protein